MLHTKNSRVSGLQTKPLVRMGILGGKKNDDGTDMTVEQLIEKVNAGVDAKLAAKFDDFKKTGLNEAIKVHIGPVTEQLTGISEALKGLAPVNNGGGTGSGQGTGTGTGTGTSVIPPEINAQLKTLSDTIKAQGATITNLTTAKDQAEKRAEETDRFSTIRSSLTGLPFVSDKAVDTAFEIVKPYVKRLDDGALVASSNGDNFPVTAFVTDFLSKEHGYLFKSSGASGSGAPASTGGLRMGAKADINDIKPGMKGDTRQLVVDSINAALASV